MTLATKHDYEVTYLNLLSTTKNYDVLLAINEDDIKSLTSTSIEGLSPTERIFRLLLHKLSKLIDKKRPIGIVNEYAGNILQLLYLVNTDSIELPESTNELCRILEILDYFSRFDYMYIRFYDDDVIYRHALECLIDAALPNDKYARMAFAHIFKTAH